MWTELLRTLAMFTCCIAIGYVGTYYVLSLVMLLVAAREAARQRRFHAWEAPEAALASGELPGISVVIPAYNEQQSITRTVESILAQRYSDLEVLVVSDGSTDGTLEVLMRKLDLRLSREVPVERIPTQGVRAIFESDRDRRLRVVDKRNGGKADAINVGINLSRKALICVIDADVLLDPLALYHLSLAFVEDASTVASSGTVRLANGYRFDARGKALAGLPGSLIEMFQVVEYARAFGVGRLFFNPPNAHVIISGAFGLFRRSVLLEVGGFHPQAIGEDMELVVRLHRHLREASVPYRILFVAAALCYTEGPTTVRDLGGQRTRWHQGLLTTLRLHRSLLLNPRYGWIGFLALPYYLLFELLPPVAEAMASLVIAMGLLSGSLQFGPVVSLVAVALFLGTTISIAALLLDSEVYGLLSSKQLLTLVLVSLLEPFGYHQLTVLFRLRSFPRFYRSIHIRGGWVSPTRGSAAAASQARAPR